MVKNYLLAGLAAVTLLPMLSLAEGAPQLKSDQDKLSYAMGYTTGQALRNHEIELNMSAYTAGIETGMMNGKSVLTESQMRQTLQDFQKQQIKKMTQQRLSEAAKNGKVGADFLAQNKKKPGVQITPSGLQYKILTPGVGESPTLADSVTVNYEGRLINGTVFDSSYKRNKPITFPLGGVIPGWQQALVMMKPGATWQVFIPSHLAYGAAGVPGSEIGPDETLIFKINLVSVNRDKK